MELREAPSGKPFVGNAGDTVICLGGKEWTTGPGGGGAPPTGPAGGDLAATYPNPTVIALEETSGPTRLLLGSIANGQGLKRVGATCVGFTIPTSLPPNGAAGGDLGGTYPNPTALALEETGGPTRLAYGVIPDGQVLARSGMSVIGVVVGLLFKNTPALLGATDASTLPNGSVASVGITNGLYRLETAPSAAVIAGADGVNIVTATGLVGAVWTRLGNWNQDARYVTDWYCDPAGNDANDGLTIGTPVRNISEIARRLRGVPLQVAVTIHLAAGSYGAVDFGDVQFAPIDLLTLTIQGAISSTAAQTLTTVTARVPAANTPEEITSTGFVFVHKNRLRLVSGAGSGAMAWVTTVVGVGDAITTAWQQISSLTAGTQTTTANPAPGDQFVVDTLLSTVTMCNMRAISETRSRVSVIDCNVSTAAPGSIPTAHRMTGNMNATVGAGAMFYRCHFSDAGGTNLLDCNCLVFCCDIETQILVQRGFVSLAGGCCYGTVQGFDGAEIFHRGSYTLDGGRVICSSSLWQSNGPDLEFRNTAGGIGVLCFDGGTMFPTSSLWWGSNTSCATGVQVSAGSRILYTTLPTLPGATQQVLLGGTAFTYAAVNSGGGMTNAVNGATMALNV